MVVRHEVEIGKDQPLVRVWSFLLRVVGRYWRVVCRDVI